MNGNYTFTGVGGGTYEVAEVVQTNWVQTQPLYPTVYSFTSRSGTNLLALNFGDHASPALTPSAVIDNGQPGYSETGSWSTVVGGFNGTNRVAKTVQAAGPRPRPRGISAVFRPRPMMCTSPSRARVATQRPFRTPCMTAAPSWGPSMSTSQFWSLRAKV